MVLEALFQENSSSGMIVKCVEKINTTDSNMPFSD